MLCVSCGHHVALTLLSQRVFVSLSGISAVCFAVRVYHLLQSAMNIVGAVTL